MSDTDGIGEISVDVRDSDGYPLIRVEIEGPSAFIWHILENVGPISMEYLKDENFELGSTIRLVYEGTRN